MPYLSHSQIELWAKCPRAWYLTKVAHEPQAPAESLILGDAVHQALEADGLTIMDEGRHLDFTALWQVMAEGLTSRLDADDPREMISDEQRTDMVAKAEAILRAYALHLQPRYSPLAVEESFDVPIPGTAWRFVGRLDARVKMPNGLDAILDFKTGKAWAVGLEHTKDQASAYLWADCEIEDKPIAWYVVFAIFPTEPDGNGGYVCRPQFRVTTRTTDQLAAYSRYLVATARAITEARAQDDFPVRLSKLCAYCGVRGSCPEGEAHLIQIGYPARVPSVKRTKEVTP